MTTSFSPDAQAVLDAFADVACGIVHNWQPGLAAAIREAVDRVISQTPPPCADFDERAQGFLAAHVRYRTELLAIAAELEGGNTTTTQEES